MPRWIPVKSWDGEDAFIIGGGDSLKSFDWNLLKSENTIGCNDAFKHGVDVCKVCIFGDVKWFKAFELELHHYKGTVFTNATALYRTRLDWLWVMKRQPLGLYNDALGWNYNTGASAVNLALLLGAKRIFLLGFDMQLSKDGKINWHVNKLDKPKAVVKVFPDFLKGFKKLAIDLKTKFPGVEVINITDDSKLNEFPKVGVKEFWEKRKAS